jgi:dihydroflavonol-4-reductase
LAARGEKVRALVRPTSRLDSLANLSLELVAGDLRDASSLHAAVRGVERIFHVAADYRLWASDPREIYESNVTGTRNLLAAAKAAGVERFIYTSTVATVAVPRPGLPNESTIVHVEEMIGHYKRSKFLAEQEAMKAVSEGLPVVIVNPTTPVGPGDWKPTPTGRIILDFVNGRMPAYLDTGLNLVPVEDVAAGHLLAAERGRIGERYLLGGRNMTLKEILDVLARITGRPAPRFCVPHTVALAAGYAGAAVALLLGREPLIPLDGVRMARHKMFVDCSRAVRELVFQPGQVEAALERAVRWYQEHGYVKGKGPSVRPGVSLPPGMAA